MPLKLGARRADIVCMTVVSTSQPSFITRRRLLQLLGAAGGATTVDMAGLLSRSEPAAAAAGPSRWSDASTWGGRVPGPGDVATVVGSVVIDADVQVAGVVVTPGSELVFDSARSATLESTGNVVVRGALRMHPLSSAVTHRVRFTGVNEAAFVGGGMDPVATDVGLWVVDGGRLDLVGATKTAWARLAADGLQGATVIQLDRVPSGWAVGDRIAVAPTGAPSASRANQWWTGFSETTIAAVAGSRITLAQSLAFDHRVVPGSWTAEVLNLTRNVQVEGTPGGRSHLFVRSDQTQAMSFAALRHVGPRRDGVKVLGRWPVHIHHCLDGTRGSVLEGVVVADAGSHAFVPHQSHGLTLRDCVAYNVQEHAFWWDDGEATDDSVWESCVAARVAETDPTGGGFYLGKGIGNVVRDCVAVGVAGSGVVSPSARNDGEWAIEDCLAHNNRHAGFKAYLNTSKTDRKVVSRLSAYHNEVGIDHGAYLNSWRYEDFNLHANRDGGVVLRAVANFNGIRFVNGTIDQHGLFEACVANARHVVGSAYTTVFERCRFSGHTLAAVALSVPEPRSPDLIDLVDCEFVGNELWLSSEIVSTCLVRLQDQVHGVVGVRRVDQPGAIAPAWNASVMSLPPFA